MVKQARIKGRLIEIEVPERRADGWIAVGIVREGLEHEKGMVFEGKGVDPGAAEHALKMEIEAYFA